MTPVTYATARLRGASAITIRYHDDGQDEVLTEESDPRSRWKPSDLVSPGRVQVESRERDREACHGDGVKLSSNHGVVVSANDA